jgi:hypothetical protein
MPGENARIQVGDAARRERHDQLDVLIGIALCHCRAVADHGAKPNQQRQSQ